MVGTGRSNSGPWLLLTFWSERDATEGRRRIRRRRRRRRKKKEEKKKRKRKKEKRGRGRKRERALKQPGAKGSFCVKIKATNGLTPLTNRFRLKWHPNFKYAKLWHPESNMQ